MTTRTSIKQAKTNTSTLAIVCFGLALLIWAVAARGTRIIDDAGGVPHDAIYEIGVWCERVVIGGFCLVGLIGLACFIRLKRIEARRQRRADNSQPPPRG